MAGEREIKIVTEVPNPPEVTPELLQKVSTEARDWRESYSAQTEGMETVTPEELKVRAK